MTGFPVTYARLLGIVPLYEAPPAFALPVFYEPGSEQPVYVQRTGENGTIVAFDRVEIDDISLRRLSVVLDRRVGDAALLAFHHDNDEIEVSERLLMMASLRHLLPSPLLEDKPFLRATIAAFCGDRDTERAAEQQALEQFGTVEIRSYYKIEVLARDCIRRNLNTNSRNLHFSLAETPGGLEVGLTHESPPSDIANIEEAVRRSRDELAGVFGTTEGFFNCSIVLKSHRSSRNLHSETKAPANRQTQTSAPRIATHASEDGSSNFGVFVSAVGSEFGKARDSLVHDLQASRMTVREQYSFRDDRDADNLLSHTAKYIETCDAVVCLIGKRSGAFPSPSEAAPFRHMLPPGFADASYAQWVFFIAYHFRKTCFLFFATDKFLPDSPPAAEDLADLQASFVEHIKSLNLAYTFADSSDDFRANVLMSLLKQSDQNAQLGKPIVLPYPSLGSLFKGRDEFLARLRSSLTQSTGGAAAITSRGVHGMGSVGKTRAVVEYAWAHRDDYTALFLIDAATPEKLQTGLSALVGPLHLAEAATADEAVRTEAALRWLQANPGWLLILDNVDADPAMQAANQLLKSLSGGHVVLTGRLAHFPRGLEQLDLDVLSLDDAASFLLEATEARRRTSPNDLELARVVAEEMGQLALALNMTTAIINERRLDFAGFRALWQAGRERVASWARPEITGYPSAIAEVWRTSVDYLTTSGRHLLELLAFLAPDQMPLSLLDVPASGLTSEKARSALENLATYSMATLNPAGGMFQVHRLLQDVTRRELTESEDTTTRVTEALGWLNDAFVGDPRDVRTWGRLDPLAPHAEAVSAYADAAGITDPTWRLMSALGDLLDAKALYSRAEQLKRRSLAILESNRDKTAPEIAHVLNSLVSSLYRTNRLNEAEQFALQALRIYEMNFGTDHPTVATALNNVAQLLLTTNRFTEAEPLLRRALAIHEATLGPDHPNVSISLNNLAQVLQTTGRFDESEMLLRHALAIDEVSLGPDHPTVARDLNNFARLLMNTDRFAEAEPLLRRALAIDEASLGPNHPAVARGLSNLGNLLQTTNRLAEAEPLLRRALAIDQASLGADHPDVARDLENLARLLLAAHQFAEAELLLRRALVIDEASLGADHPNVSNVLYSLARLLHATNRLAEAEVLLRRVLATVLAFERGTGHSHPHRDAVIASYLRLATGLGKDEAETKAVIDSLLQGGRA